MMKNIWFKLCGMLFVYFYVNFAFFESFYCEKLKTYKLQPIKLPSQWSNISFFVLLCSLFNVHFAYGQSRFNFPDGFHKWTFSFEVINNLIVVPIKINGTEFNFIIDSGVNNTILFNSDLISNFDFKNKKSINLKGFSNVASIKACQVEADLFEIDCLKSYNHELLILAE